MYSILIDEKKFGMNKNQVMEALKAKGIETRSFFLPMHKQPVYAKNDDRFPDINGKYPVSESLFERGLYLPSGSSLTKEQIKTVADALKSLRT